MRRQLSESGSRARHASLHISTSSFPFSTTYVASSAPLPLLVPRRVDRSGRNEQDVAGPERSSAACPRPDLQRAVEDVDDLLARMPVPTERHSRVELDARLCTTSRPGTSRYKVSPDPLDLDTARPTRLGQGRHRPAPAVPRTWESPGEGAGAGAAPLRSRLHFIRFHADLRDPASSRTPLAREFA
jgi:hypothetical protein